MGTTLRASSGRGVEALVRDLVGGGLPGMFGMTNPKSQRDEAQLPVGRVTKHLEDQPPPPATIGQISLNTVGQPRSISGFGITALELMQGGAVALKAGASGQGGLAASGTGVAQVLGKCQLVEAYAKPRTTSRRGRHGASLRGRWADARSARRIRRC